MSGTVTFAGTGSGIDVESIISSLKSANSTQLNALNTRVTAAKTASSDISSISSLVAKLKTAVDDLADINSVQSYKATSSASGVTATVTGNASAGSYQVDVEQLAQEYRAYSNAQTDKSTALGLSGNLDLTVGSKSASISVTNSDSLDSILTKVSNSGLRVQGSLFYDGSQYRLQLRGMDTGDNAQVTVGGTVGNALGFNTSSNIVQQAQNAKIKVDGFEVTSNTNQFTSAIPGVTLAVTNTTSSTGSVSISTDADGLKTRLQSMVDAYNAIVTKVHTVAGYGTTKGTDESLAGNNTLRTMLNRMSSSITTNISTGTSTSTLRGLGLSLQSDGTLSLDSSKLTSALAQDPQSVSQVLAGAGTGQGIMDMMSTLADTYSRSSDGILTNQQQQYDNKVKRYQTSMEEENDRLTNWEEQLRKQFTEMDSTVSTNNSLLKYLTSTTSSSG